MEHDYRKIGLKSGLEIHQQLNTDKLFCSCPSVLQGGKPARVIRRVLNPVVGETGEIDAAALHEKEKDLTFNYQVFDTNCLVELDEEPPHEINKEALRIALQIAHLLNCHIFPVSQVMRKTVIDGSNTSGFQRTVIIGYGGYVETSLGKVVIDSIALEEDSARPVSENSKEKTFKLDRLGIPLVEITTAPDLKTPEQIKEAALKIGEILRACNVKRGIGTIRQDVNVSIKGSKRVEIKGFQDPKIMIKTVDTEIARQQKLVKDKSCKSEVRGANPDGTTTFLRPMPGAARMYPETDIPLLKISHSLINETKKDLPKLASENKGYLKEFGLNEELIILLLKSGRVEDFKTLTHTTKDYGLIAKALTLFQKEIAKKEDKTSEEVSEILDAHVLEAVLENVGEKISSNDVKVVLQKLVQGESLDEAMEKSDIDLEAEALKLIKEKPGLSQGAYMGLLMKMFNGSVSGKEVSDVLRKVM
jgi:Glu-tRNA(Gln) amidotransferase subunit E-like FAD-binding protein